MRHKVMQVGNSLGVTVPSDFVKAVGIKVGDNVEVKKQMDTNEVIYKFSGIQQLPIAQSFLGKRRKRIQ